MANPALDEMVTRLDAISRNIEITTAKLAAVSGHVGPVVSNAEEITADLRTVSGDKCGIEENASCRNNG